MGNFDHESAPQVVPGISATRFCPLTTGGLIGVRPRNLRLSVGRATAFGYLGRSSICTGDMRSM